MSYLRTLPLLMLVLAGCAGGPETPRAAQATSAATPQQEAVDDTPITGSRFARRSSDRLVRVIGQEAARSDMSNVRSLGNEVGARGN